MDGKEREKRTCLLLNSHKMCFCYLCVCLPGAEMICKYCGESFQKQGNTDGSCPASTDGNQRHATKPSEQFQHLIDSAAASQQQEKEQFQHLIDSAAASLELEKSSARREERERKERYIPLTYTSPPAPVNC